MITPLYEEPRRSPREHREYELLQAQIVLGQARVGCDAAREIARHIEEQGGFWDHPGWEHLS